MLRYIALAIALVVALFIVKQVAFGPKDTNSAESQRDGEKIYEIAAKISGIDVSAFDELPERLEKVCARNKYGLTEEQCVLAVRSRKEVCAQRTAQEYPGTLSDVNRMQAAVKTYVDCIFEKQ